MKSKIDSLLPHTLPAILLQEIVAQDGNSLTATARLGELQSPWMETAGMPIAFGLEIIAQAAAIAIFSQVSADHPKKKLAGGRLVSTDRFHSSTEFLPADREIAVTAELLESSSMGYYRCAGRIREGDRELLSVEFTVLTMQKQ